MMAMTKNNTSLSLKQVNELIITQNFKEFEKQATYFDDDIFDNGNLLFWLVSTETHLPFIKCLIEKNINVDKYLVSYREGQNLLMKAALNANEDMFDFLVSHTALYQMKHIHAIDNEKANLLHFACCEGSLSFVQKLINTYDLDINQKDNDGLLPEDSSEIPEVIDYIQNLRMIKAEKQTIEESLKTKIKPKSKVKV